jgi:putative hydrolase of the HAD superfamily
MGSPPWQDVTPDGPTDQNGVMAKAIEAVLFDLDDTLLDGAAAWRSGMETLLLARCPQLDRIAALDAWDTVFEEYFARYLAGALTFEASRIARVRAWAEAVSVEVAAGDELSWFDDYLAGYQSGWAAFDDVEPTLPLLQGFRLGVITNGDGGQQQAKLTALGLGSAFEVVVCSGDVGFAKPDRRIFHVAADRLGLSPDLCLFVGDRRDSDALGAIGAGMSALWLNRKGHPSPDDLVTEIETLHRLPTLLAAPPAGGNPGRSNR